MKQSKMDQGNGEVKHKTEDERKTKVQLIGELAEMRQRIVELEANAKQIEPVLAEHEQIYQVMDESTCEFIAISNQLECLHGIAAIAEKSEITLDELYQEVANLLPSSWQYPEICCARITTEDKEFRTANYRDAKWKLCSDIKIGGVKAGAVEVNYLEKRPKLDEGPFSRDERRLIDAVAAQMGRITERKRAEKELFRLSSAVKMSTDSIVISNLEAKIIDVNEATLKMYGTDDKRDLIGKNSFDLIAPEELEKALAGTKEVLEKGYVKSREYHIITKGGGRVPVEMSIAIMKDTDGKPIGFVGVSRDITEHKKAEEALKESEERLSFLLENIPDFVITVDHNHKILMINRGIPGIITAEQAIGTELFNYVEPAHHEIMRESLEKVFQTGMPERYEVLGMGPEGPDTAWYETRVSPNKLDGQVISVTLISSDITERKKAEKRLQESEEKLRVMFGSIADGVIVTDLTGTVVEANDGAAHLVGYSNKEELIGRNAFEFVSPKDRALAMDATKKTLEEGLVQEKTEYTILTADGEEIDTDSSAAVLYDSSGNPVGIINVVRDITERKRAEQELRERNEQLKAQREELVRKATELELVSQAKSEFLASMSHELRTPLSAIIGFSELILDGIPGEVNDEQRGCVNDILDSGKHLLSLINDILDLSKVEAGKIELKLQNLDIANIVSGVVQIMRPVLDKNRQEIEVSVIQGLPKVRGDENRLEQILLNLLSNASKFTDQGGRVRIHVGRKGNYCQVAVIDTGIGIKKEDQEHMFEAFIQGETLSDRKKEGTGLGLTLTKQFVEAIGGRIWMESEYGKGSTFIFTIPLAGELLETSLGDKQSSYS